MTGTTSVLSVASGIILNPKRKKKMSLTAKFSGGGGSFVPVPPGMHLGRCYRIIDLGTQESTYMGVTKKLPKVMLQFEIHGEDNDGKPILTDKGDPMSISKNFTLSLSDKATLRIDLQRWRGREFTSDELRGFELKNVLGAWAMLSVIKATGNDGKEYTNIDSINSVPPAIKKSGLPDGVNKAEIFDIENPNMAMYETFGKGLQAKIALAPEWNKKPSAPVGSKGSGFEDMDSDIPF